MLNKKKEEPVDEVELNYFNITDFLLTLTTSEYAALIVEGRDVIHGMGYDGINNEFDAIMRTRLNRTTEDILSDVNQLMHNVLDEILKAHGIRLEINTTIYIKINLLKAINQIVDYYDPEQLLSSFQLAVTEDPLDVFTDILEEIIGEEDSDEIMMSVKSVNKSLLKTIKTQLEELVEEMPSGESYDIKPVPDEFVVTLKNLMSFITDSEKMILPYKVANTVPLGLPIDFYFAELVTHYKESNETQLVAGECIVAALAALNPIEKVESVIASYLSYFYLRETDQLQVLVCLRSLLGAISNGAK